MRRLVYFSLILNLSSVLAHSSTYTNFTYVITETVYGAVRGMRVLQDDGKYLDVFAGIPFASPPIGDLRFAHPKPPLPWVGTIKDTFRFKAACPQREWFLLDSFESFDNYDEDCLYLNIYAPHVPSEQNSYPVMLWIYGGAYEYGTAEEYDGSILAQKNVVVVTTNYRIGVLGWLSTDNDVAPGNYGLLDQIEAMKWVKGNIAKFGGDPSRVTIFGESAGGGSVGLHLFLKYLEVIRQKCAIDLCRPKIACSPLKLQV
ncbi:neuroligin-4, X-linked-like [Ptychodera flava]|uniref:neuroligin-4, X-linked-like n=1 Tax=Ptychodera flava TaxID=63121 RepID=UPI003969F230